MRVLDQLYPRNLSLQTLDGVITHNGEFAAQVLKRGTTSTFKETMFEQLYERLLDDLVHDRRDSPLFRHHVKSLLKTSHSLTEEGYLAQEPNRIVVDYIASMTDNYFMNIYARLFPESHDRIQRDYYDAR